MLKIRNLEAGYGNLRVLKGISIHINPGEIVSIIGANGAGKTTLLNTIGGLIKARSGNIVFKNEEVTGVKPHKLIYMGCSLVPEGRKLFATMTVRENLILGAYNLYKRKNKKNVQQELDHIYKLFPRLQEREAQLAGTLSGGEQQMVAIARSLMGKPDLVMMDEPSMGLAPLIVKDIFNVVVKLRNEGKTILLVEQNAKAALKIADRGYVIETGGIILEGTSEELLTNHDVQRAYLGKDYRSIAE